MSPSPILPAGSAGEPLDPPRTGRADVDRGLIAAFLRKSPEERVAANDAAVRAILELRQAFSKRNSQDPRDRQRLPVLEETLRQRKRS
jgi:hypothetical protein